MKDQTYWAVFTPDGDMRTRSITRSKLDSIEVFLTLYNLSGDWDYYKSEGYTVSKIKITKIEE